ncbi:MAG: DsbA family oxidoreductase [Mycobacteriales bacterium]
MGLIVYADVTCPDCLLAVRRADALAAAGVPVDVRVVEQRPELPVTGRRLTGADQEAITRRFERLGALLLPGETLPWSMPPVAARTQASVSAYAEVYGSPVAADVRRLLFDLYWREGADIGNPNVLRTPLTGPVLRSGILTDPLWQSGYAVAVSGGPVTTAAHRRIRAWRDEWHELGSPALPLLLIDGATVHGIDALRRLGKELRYADADPDPALDEPRRYPAVGVRPSRSWVSQIGNRWRNVYRPAGAT